MLHASTHAASRCAKTWSKEKQRQQASSGTRFNSGKVPGTRVDVAPEAGMQVSGTCEFSMIRWLACQDLRA